VNENAGKAEEGDMKRKDATQEERTNDRSTRGAAQRSLPIAPVDAHPPGKSSHSFCFVVVSVARGVILSCVLVLLM
jgi:hypothetical protein